MTTEQRKSKESRAKVKRKTKARGGKRIKNALKHVTIFLSKHQRNQVKGRLTNRNSR